MDLEYSPRRAPRDLDEVLVCQWDARMVGEHVLVPDGCVELMWLEGRGIVVCGPETSAWPVHHVAPREASGVRLRPGLATLVLERPLYELTDRRADLADLLPGACSRELTDRVESADRGERSTVLADAVRRALHHAPDPPKRPRIALRWFERGESMAALADELGTTTRTLHRWSRTTFGYGPATVRSILRLQRALAWRKATPHLRIADVAAFAGYADQSHLARDVRAIAAMTPTELFASPSADWHGDGEVVRVRSVQDDRRGASVPSSS